MYLHEEYVQIKNNNEDNEKRYGMGDSGYYEPFTDNKKRLFRALLKENGRCVSKVYVDGENGKAFAIGYVFQKKEKYTDCNEYFIRETWVTFHEKQPTTKITEYPIHIDERD
jgi:hypothetical protein